MDDFLSSEDVERAPVKSIIEGHLANLIGGFNSYFPDVEEKSVQLDCSRNPFLLSEANRRMLPVSHQEKLCVIWPWPTDEAWHIHSHTVLGVMRRSTLSWERHFWSYLCEASYSAMTDQNKAKKQTAPGKEFDHCSCLPATDNDKDPQWSTSTCFSLNCECNLSKRRSSMQLQCHHSVTVWWRKMGLPWI